MTAEGWRCSDAARERDEPGWATASLVEAWLLIEQPGAWGPDALSEGGLPEDVASALHAAPAGVRVLLIRRTGRREPEPVVIFAQSGAGGATPTMSSAVLSNPTSLLDLDLAALVAGGSLGIGRPVDHPIYLVCTHGRHDICCADKGRPLFRAMSPTRPEQVWECSHIGGDRFAGNLVVLPRGDYFGGLDPDDAEGVVTRYEAGRLDLDHYRGRSTRPRLVQAAEHFLRTRESWTGLDDVEAVAYRRPSHDHADVTLRGPDGGLYTVRVEARPVPPPVHLTCRADQPDHPVAYDLVEMTKL